MIYTFLFVYLIICVVACIFFVLSEKIKNSKMEQMQMGQVYADLENGGTEGEYKISFYGDGKTFFKIWTTNLLLTICTLGIYYPWGRAKNKKYLYSSTYLGEHNFEFHGTGRQLFKGLLKFFIIMLLVFAGLMAIADADIIPELELSQEVIGLLIYIPYAPVLALFIHGARKYGMAKTSHRGIRLGYRGIKNTLVLYMLRDAILTLITLGLYWPCIINNIRKYIYSNTKFGDIKFDYSGKSSHYWCFSVFGWIGCIFTLGVLYPWFKKELFNFFYENISFSKDNQLVKIKSNATSGKFFKLIIGNLLIILLSLGLGYPFAKVRSMKFIAENLNLYGNIDLNNVVQAEKDYSNAIGEAETDMDDSANFFDLDIF